jgi:D-3-phosphoglycerate dehydrogenase / 2-oxoglutarate reductase
VKPKVVVAETLAQTGIDALAGSCEVDIAVGLSRAELMSRLTDAAGLVVRSATDVDREMLLAAPNLKVVGRAGIGVDNIDLATATERGVLVVNAPHANTVSAAEHTMALLLSQARSIPQAHSKLIGGNWDRKSFTGVELAGKTLGVIGLGKIGTLVAQRCLAFGMKVVAYDPFVSADRARRLGVELLELDQLFPLVDFMTIHLPKTKETEGLLGKENLAKCKPGVRIVNTSRGGIIDEAALADAISSGHVAGAGLDVFAVEPTTASPLFELPQVVVTPHLAASTAEAQDKAGTDTAEAVAAALRGELVLSAVNVDLGREVSDEVRAFLPLAEQLGRSFVGLSGGMAGRIVLRAQGRIAGHELRPLQLALLKGALSGYSTEPVSYVNAGAIADQRGLVIEIEAFEESEEYVSMLSVCDADCTTSLAGTISRKGPMMVEILGNDMELPFSDHVLIVRNLDVPGVIGRVGTYLGELGVNIANMVVGRSRETGAAAMMGINVDQPLGDDQLSGLRSLEGIEEARYLDLA